MSGDHSRPALVQNPQILHPVAVKGTREEQAADSEPELAEEPPPAPPHQPPPAALAARPPHRKALRHCECRETGD